MGVEDLHLPTKINNLRNQRRHVAGGGPNGAQVTEVAAGLVSLRHSSQVPSPDDLDVRGLTSLARHPGEKIKYCPR